MPRYNLLFRKAAFIAAMLLLLGSLASAQYWFQSGARGSNSASFNNGASVAIQTIYQNATNGSLGFWVGENLANGAFIQTGYEITNFTGYYSTSCGNSTKSVFLDAGVPTWFWEYFSPGSKNSSFCGGIGANGSAGRNGGFNTYGFEANGNVWSAYFNNHVIGSVNLDSSNSGPNPPSAFAEYAETNTNKWPIIPVEFRNLIFYIGNSTRLVPQAYAISDYGKGSLTSLPNLYGVKEVGDYVSDFKVGSGINTEQQNGLLWQIGYTMKIYSTYGNITGSGNYSAYSIVPLSAPKTVNISDGIREAFVGWVGQGVNSYNGNSTNHSVTMYSNTTESAIWKRQYYLNATTEYGKINGAGWYDSNSIAQLFMISNLTPNGNGTREFFTGWNSSNSTKKLTIYMNAPKNIHALWTTQYYLSVESEYGNTTGSGWYDSNSIANITINSNIIPVNSTERIEFYNWSNGNFNNNISVVVAAPTAITATFKKQYLVTLYPQNSNGENLTNVSYYNVSSKRIYSNNFFAFENKTYNIEYIYYKGVEVATNYKFSVNSPLAIGFKTPIYNIVVQTQSIFGTPVNASLNITFKNNTKLVTYSGSKGIENFSDVPYGYIAGYAEYFGIKQSVNAVNGFSPYLTFLTGSLVALIIGGVMLIVIIAKLAANHSRRGNIK